MVDIRPTLPILGRTAGVVDRVIGNNAASKQSCSVDAHDCARLRAGGAPSVA
jgi:hypothetical protein